MIYPKELRVMARRTGAHTAFRRLSRASSELWAGEPLGPLPRLLVVIPELMLAAHARDVEAQLPSSLRLADAQASIECCLDYLENAMGIKVFQSPPNPLRKLVPLTKRAGPWVLDIDVDYIHEMQGECYTRVINPGRGVLQKKQSVIELVREARPSTITLSEAKVSAIRDPGSAFSGLVAEFRAMGYEISERAVFESDAEVMNGIAVCREFYARVSRVLARKSIRDGRKGVEDFREAETVAAKKFFRDKGYSNS